MHASAPRPDVTSAAPELEFQRRLREWIAEQQQDGSPEEVARVLALGLDVPDNGPAYEQGYSDALDRLTEFLAE